MTVFEYSVMAVCVSLYCFAMAYLFWATRCNNVTYRERRKLLYWIHHKHVAAMLEGKPRMSYWKAFDAVAYYTHYKTVFWLKDRSTLYGSELSDAFSN